MEPTPKSGDIAGISDLEISVSVLSKKVEIIFLQHLHIKNLDKTIQKANIQQVAYISAKRLTERFFLYKISLIFLFGRRNISLQSIETTTSI